ncbi:MAG: hypothetical protein AABX55_02660, partial [Nanoarchaeota archaeon]
LEENELDFNSFRNIFFKDFNLQYILYYAIDRNIHLHIATHSKATSTCEEKSQITGLPLERVIKGVYLEDTKEEKTYAISIPGTKHSSDIRLKLANFLGINDYEIIKDNRIRKARKEFLPVNIEYGTVHPIVNLESFTPNGKLELILFDKKYLEKRRLENGLDDFSFTTHPSTGYDNHRISLQINYASLFEILRFTFGDEKVKTIDLI